MSMWLRQSTASQEILLGRFVDSSDGDTEESGLTIANTDIKLWKDGATTLASKNSGGATHISGGNYYAVLDATDTDTLGKLEVHVHVAGALAVKREYMVLPAMVYDSLVLGTDALDVNVTQFGGLAGQFTSGRPDVQNVQGDVGGNVNGTVASVVGDVGGNLSGMVAGSVGSVASSVDVATFDGQAIVQTSGKLWVLDGSGNAIAPAALFSGITNLAQWLGLLAGKQTGNTTARTELRATGAGSGTFDETTDALQAIRDRGDAAWTTGGGSGTSLATGTIVSTTGTTTTLDSGALANADFYVGAKLLTTSGTGANQERVITGYSVGRVATHAAWDVDPDNTTTYAILPARSPITQITVVQS